MRSALALSARVERPIDDELDVLTAHQEDASVPGPAPRDYTAQVLSDRDLMGILGVGHAFFYAKKKLRVYDFLRCRPQLGGRHTQYSGTLVQLWIDGGAGSRQSKHSRKSQA